MYGRFYAIPVRPGASVGEAADSARFDQAEIASMRFYGNRQRYMRLHEKAGKLEAHRCYIPNDFM